MSTLSGRTPAATFGNLLQIEGGAPASLTVVTDGSGTSLPFKLTTSASGKFLVTGDLLPIGGVSVSPDDDYANYTNVDGQICVHGGNIAGSGDAVYLCGPVVAVNNPGSGSAVELKVRFDDSYVVVPNNSVSNFEIKVLASNSDFSKVAAWNASGVVKKDSLSSSVAFIGTPGSTSLVTPPTGWYFLLEADTSNGAIKVSGNSDVDAADWVCSYTFLQLKPTASGGMGTGTLPPP